MLDSVKDLANPKVITVILNWLLDLKSELRIRIPTFV